MSELIITLRPYFELLFFISGMVLAGAAIYALQQISIMKHDTDIRTRRESRIIAAEIVSEFNAQISPKYENYIALLSKSSRSSYKMESASFKQISTQEAEKLRDYVSCFDEEHRSTAKSLVDNIEKLVINISNGIADTDYAFNKIGVNYCVIIASLAPFILLHKHYYNSCIDLYDSWNSMIVSQKLENELALTMNKLQTIQVNKIQTLR